MTKVAVLLSHYDGDNFVKEQIDSILNQKLSSNISLNLFVRDDGSPNSNLSILKKYDRLHKIKLIEGENVGVRQSFYKLMEEVQDFDYYFFSDQDDVWVKNKVDLMISELEKFEKPNQPIGVFSDLYIADKDANTDGKLMKHEALSDLSIDNQLIKENILKYYMVTGASFAFNQAALEQALHLGFDVFNKTNMHDSTFAFMLALEDGLIYLDKPLVFYRQHGSNVIGYKKSKTIIGKIFDIKNIFEDKVKKLYDVYLISNSIETLRDERIITVQKIFEHNKFMSTYYAWKLRRSIFGPHIMLSMFLFILFGIKSVGNFQSELEEQNR